MGLTYSRRTMDADSRNGIRCEFAKIDSKHARAEVWIDEFWSGYKEAGRENERTHYQRRNLLFSNMRVDTWFLNDMSSYSLITVRGLDGGDEEAVIDCMDQHAFDKLPYQAKEVAKVLVAVGRNIERELGRRTLNVSNEIDHTLAANGVRSVEVESGLTADHHVVPIFLSLGKQIEQ